MDKTGVKAESRAGGFFSPLARAWQLAGSPAVLPALAALALLNGVNQYAMAALAASRNMTGLGLYSLVSGFALVLLVGGVIFMLGRRMAGAGSGARMPNAALVFVLLLLAYGIGRWFAGGLLNAAVFAGVGGENARLAAMLAAIVPSILFCPLVVRLFALAMAHERPGLGQTFGALWSTHFAYLGCYALVSVAASALFWATPDVLRSLPMAGMALTQGLITGLTQLAALLVAAAAACDLAPGGTHAADVFS